MTHKKHVVFTLAIVMVAVIALSVSTAFAGDFSRQAPVPPSEEHPPVCYKVESFAPGSIGLECFDIGKDIVDVGIKTNAKYELNWNAETVSLRIYINEKGTSALWYVQDKNGSVVSGTLP